MDVSIIISYRESDDKRKRNLICVLNYLSWLMSGNSEIILVEQDKISKVNWLTGIKKNEYIKHIFVENPGTFNKGWGYNIGVKISKNNTIIFNDTDVIVKLDTYKYALNLLKKYDIVNPYKDIIFLDEKDTKNFINYNCNYNNLPFYNKKEAYVISGGIFLMKKESYLDIKGFDEDCYGYGHEDDIFDFKIRKLKIPYIQINDVSVHLYHDKLDQNYYNLISTNKKLLDIYLNMTIDELKNKIESISNIGEIGSNTLENIIKEKIKCDITDDLSKKIIDIVLQQITDEFIDNIINDSLDDLVLKMKDILIDKLKIKFKELKLDGNKKNNIFVKIKKLIFNNE